MAYTQPSLDLLEKKLAKEFSSYGTLAAELAVYAAGGRGKRLRPAVLFLSGQLFGPIQEEHIQTAMAIELIHTATLVHDDIIDEAQIRRKKPSLNHAYGQELAVMVGDLILSHAMNLLVHLPTQHPAQEITHIANLICEGEMIQTFRRFHFGITEKEYFDVIDKKTASLFEVSCRLGTEFSGATKVQSKVVGEFGRQIGLAFQIIDDCLDIVGDEGDLGKSLGTDMKKGKFTLPFIRLLHRLKGEEKKKFDEWIKAPLTLEKMQNVKKVLQKEGAVEEAAEVAADLIAQAKTSLEQLRGIKNKTVLQEMCRFSDRILDPLREKFPVFN